MLFPFQLKKLFLLILFILSGLILAAVSGILFFKKIPSDFNRTQHLLEFIQSQETDQSTIMLGNSIAMDGFDAKLFSKGACISRAYNLSSPGQNQLETLLLISSLKGNPKTIIHLINTQELPKDDFLSKQVAYNFMLYGYKINDFALSSLLLTKSSIQLSYFYTSWYKVAFESRWLITNYINTKFRSLLRNDLSLDHLVSELYYPRNYTQKFPEEKLLPLIGQFNPPEPVTSFSIDTTKLMLLKRTSDYLAGKKIKYVIVFSPLNPRLNNYKQGYFDEMEKFITTNTIPNAEIINLSKLLSSEEFVDHIHPSEDGAMRISLHLAKILSQCSSKQ